MAALGRFRCAATLTGHTHWARLRRPVDTTRRSHVTLRGAQVGCVVVLSHGRVVSGSVDRTLKVWDVSSGQCLRTLRGHTDSARRRRPVERRVDRSSTPRRAQVLCVAILPSCCVVSGSRDHTLKVWDVSSGQCLCTLTGHTDWARRRRPVE